MATLVNQTPPARYTRIPSWLRDLAFVTDFFSWLFALCSRLAEPLMLLCTLYIVAEAGVPAIAVPALHNLAIGIMICAPEIILPGSFVVAARAQEHARLLFAVCWIFVGLTLLTLISLFVWHFTGTSLAWLMCARCAAAVGYSILIRVMSHDHNQTQMVPVPGITAQITNLAEQVLHIETNTTAHIAASEQHIATILQAQPDMSLLVAQVVEQLDARYTKQMETMIERTVEPVNMSSVQQNERRNNGRARLSIVNGLSVDTNTSGEIQALPLDTSDSNIGQQIRSLLLEDSTLSGRALALRVGCSPTTANKWKSRIEGELQAQSGENYGSASTE